MVKNLAKDREELVGFINMHGYKEHTRQQNKEVDKVYDIGMVKSFEQDHLRLEAVQYFTVHCAFL